MRKPISLALVGIGEIARKQHIPSIASSSDFTLAAAASRSGHVEDIDNFGTLEDLLVARPDIEAVSLCTPPQFRFDIAYAALMAGKHVMLEKPPGATISEVETLERLASQRGLSLFATWHSRYAASVEPARDWLSDKTVKKVQMIWHESVRKWHPGQIWISQAGGMGVFDPGINGLSILTYILPQAFHLTSARLAFPTNWQTPIAATLAFTDQDRKEISADFDWRDTEIECWTITVETRSGVMELSNGGASFSIDGIEYAVGPNAEYNGLYGTFADLINHGLCDVDLRPMKHAADAFTLGERVVVEEFHT